VNSPESPVLGPDLVTEGLGAFDELEFLGRGEFGETYRAVRGEDEYALKVIHRSEMPEHLWERETESLRRVDHPNVVGFRDSGHFEVRDRSYPYLECEYTSGGSIKAKIDEGVRPASGMEIKALLTGLLAGVAEIHDLGILHRDIKPANAAIRDDDWGKPVLLDFGLARVLDMSSHTEYPTRIGTLAYMAPEQLRGQPARRRSDLYSVAVVVYQAASGQHPFLTPDISSVQTLHDRIKAGGPTVPQELSEAMPADVSAVLLRLLAFRGHERLGVSEAFRDMEGL
jgi:serine/threonine protein kinase